MNLNLDHVLSWVRDTLALNQTPGWYRIVNIDGLPSFQPNIPFYLENIMRQFYGRDDRPFIASVTAEASRDPIGRRHLGFAQSLTKNSLPVFMMYADRIKYKRTIKLFDDLKLSTKDFRFTVPLGIDERFTRLTRMYSERVIPRPKGKPVTGRWITWCIAEEDSDKLLAGSAPASKNLLIVNDVNPARLMTWWKLYPSTGWTHTIAFDIDPYDGSVFSIRFAEVQLEMQILLDPWLDDWLLEFISKQKHIIKSVGSRSV